MSFFAAVIDENSPIAHRQPMAPKRPARDQHRKTQEGSTRAFKDLNATPQQPIQPKKVAPFPAIDKENAPPAEKKLSFAEMARKTPVVIVKKVEAITHENAIFGSYCLEDVKSITSMVFKAMPHQKSVKFDCFNYETVQQICDHEGLKEIFDRNIQFLEAQTAKGLIQYEIHYKDVNNDLMQKRENVTPETDWHKFDRIYLQNMIFFNPYFETGAKTAQLITAFFRYAQASLEKEGVVTIMWNTQRIDRGFEEINVRMLGREQGFTCVKTLSGGQFARLFGFKHTKNSTSLEVSQGHTVSTKNTDHLMLFMRFQGEGVPSIPAGNKVATAFIQTLNVV